MVMASKKSTGNPSPFENPRFGPKSYRPKHDFRVHVHMFFFFFLLLGRLFVPKKCTNPQCLNSMAWVKKYCKKMFARRMYGRRKFF